MAIVITADWHLVDSPREEYRFDVFDRVLEVGRAREASALFLLGDVTHRKDRHPGWFLQRLTRGFVGLLKHYERIYILQGNHDYEDATASSLQFLGLIDGVEYIHNPRLIQHAGRRVMMLPHTHQPDLWRSLDFARCDLVCCHQCFDGFVSENGRKLTGTAQELLSRRVTRCPVVAGDVHSPQTIGNITYVGAPHPIAFGDDYETRVVVWDDDNNLVPVPVPSIKKITAKLSSVKQLDLLGLEKGDHLKIIYELEAEAVDAWPKRREMLRRRAVRRGLDLRSIVARHEHTSPEREVKSDLLGRGDLSQLEQYCADHKVPDTLASVGRSLLADLG